MGTAFLQTWEVGKVSLLAQTNAQSPRVLTTHILPASPSPPTQAIAIGTLRGGGWKALLNPRDTHSLLPIPWGEGEPWLSTS